MQKVKVGRKNASDSPHFRVEKVSECEPNGWWCHKGKYWYNCPKRRHRIERGMSRRENICHERKSTMSSIKLECFTNKEKAKVTTAEKPHIVCSQRLGPPWDQFGKYTACLFQNIHVLGRRASLWMNTAHRLTKRGGWFMRKEAHFSATDISNRSEEHPTD